MIAAPAAADPVAELRQRADAGDAEALNALGNAYANGQGVEQDFAAAARYYSLAASRGYAPAQFNLGLTLYGRGLKSEAIPFLGKASESPDPGIRDATKSLLEKQ